MMKHMGYDFKKKLSLNFGKGVRTQPRPFIPKGKDANYYNISKIGLGYVSNPTTSESNSKELVYHDPLSSTSSWSSDASVGVFFRALSVNTVSTSHPKEDENDGLPQSKDNP